MHKQSYEAMETFVREHVGKQKGVLPLSVLDIGSLDVNGSYRDLFSPPRYSYKGLDIQEGKNVDIVSKLPYNYHMIEDKVCDIVISGNTMEHVKAIWRWMIELKRILKKGGLICLITPHTMQEHRYPVDCWRVLPDGMEALLKHAGLEILEIRRKQMDTVGIARKL